MGLTSGSQFGMASALVALSVSVCAFGLELKDLRPEFHPLKPPAEISSQLNPTVMSTPSIQREPQAIVSQPSSVREILGDDEVHRITRRIGLQRVEKHLNRTIALVGTAASNQRISLDVKPTQSRASLRYIGFGESELSYNPITESFILQAHLNRQDGSQVIAEWLSGPLETSQRVSWQWRY